MSGEEIIIHNKSGHRIPSKKFFIKSIEKTLKVLAERKKITLALVFISPQESKKLNKYWRKKDKIALVLSFPLKNTVPSESKLLGDIFFCPQEIEKQSVLYGLSRNDFYRKLTVHSLLHLYGYTHQRKKDTKQMELLEAKILQ